VAKIKGKRSGRFMSTLFLVAVIGVLLGLTVTQFIRQQTNPLTPPNRVEESDSLPIANNPDGQEENFGWRYAQALQRGHFAWVVEHTLWMQERLQRVKGELRDNESVEKSRQALFQRLSVRKAAKNQLTPTGIADQYIFAPGTRLEFLSVDAGRTGLAEPTAQRIWIRVSYPERDKALRDVTNIPIRSIAVGVNVSHDNKILKANIVGNLEIALDSITYEW